MSTTNHCLIDPKKGAITVKIIANNGIRTAGKFWLFELVDSEYKAVDSDMHEIATGDTGLATFNIEKAPKEMKNNVMTWVINSCSFVPGVENGNVKIEFWQDGVECKTTSKSDYYGDYPLCSSGNARSHKNQILFTLIEELPINPLWSNIN